MKVVFLENDRIEEVSDGYARNYLLPRKLAVPATPPAVAAAEKRGKKREAELEQKKVEMKTLAEKLSALEIVMKAEAGEGGKLFGAVTSSDIAAEVKKASGIDLDRKKIELEEPIKVLGEYKVPVKFFQDISALLKVTVSAK
ncbi:50S ribosomal protein L9 [Candidatus Saganbacteria bacterium]|uniref:Large ribosomal subunit protein bL9 n=1 Tax=Candidatus Saganbacteria bacterium TaxID=2575572 RepID=A0A9D6UKJ5_UNCSA|nr:50S ribosomal protein L9 [Candidatus Saganbacteria bacterium]